MATPKKLPTVLTENEQARLLEQPNPRYPTGERNRTMLNLMLNTGLRLAEVTALKWRDLDLTTGKLIVRQGKGAKDRTLWVAEADIDRLRSWRERQAAPCGQCEHIFTTLQGKPLGHRYVQRMVKRYAAKAGIDKDVSPHTLRHSFATDLYRETSKIRLVQKVLGHSDLSTTMIYTHVFDPEVEEALKSFRQTTAVTV
ncbi:tyrosine-type recombinase/integrase [Candidatus Bipolaricaulota bacterium]|nr:tyrosine-type recombinase/integrase [Candidatus Bipolaricaulota bacterium]